MKLNEEVLTLLLSEKEAIEPETLSYWGVTDEKERLALLSLASVKNTNLPWEDFDVFENTVHALNGIDVVPLNIEGCLPVHLKTTLNWFYTLDPTGEISHEVRKYIEFWMREEGYNFLPIFPQLESFQPSWFKEAAELAATGPFPLTGKDSLELQAIHILKWQQLSI
jgi:hypothetical protein